VNVKIGVAQWDQGIEHLQNIVQPRLAELSLDLTGNYGGLMDHLWISLELAPSHADGRPPWPFRFQKKVVPSRDARALGATPSHNVGHYSVRPDHAELATIHLENVACYLMRVVYESTAVLATQRRKVGDFDAEQFRARFRTFLEQQGCT
jgi:hypothetical protein